MFGRCICISSLFVPTSTHELNSRRQIIVREGLFSEFDARGSSLPAMRWLAVLAVALAAEVDVALRDFLKSITLNIPAGAIPPVESGGFNIDILELHVPGLGKCGQGGARLGICTS